MRFSLLPAAACFLFSGIVAPSALAQQSCQPPPSVPATPGVNLFNDAQENDLGDVVAEHLQRNFLVIDDEDYTGYLQRIGDRLLKHVPSTQIHFRFFLFDLPTVNAFTMPGGRIYVSRKLIAFAHSEDEIAAVLGHEIGHMVVREPARAVSTLFQQILGVTQIAGPENISARYNELLDNLARKTKSPSFSRKLEEQGQATADSIGIYAMAGAGYDPQAASQFWDRTAETKGKTGGFFSDLFGLTNPESRRLREMLRAVAALPAACREPRTAAPAPEEFRKWQTAVVNYSGLGHKESLHAVLAKTLLNPPLQTTVNNLKFSPDGNLLLAQDESSIYVLKRNPLGVLFRIDAIDARPAHFTPDSLSIVFHHASLRVESWSVTDQQRSSVSELVIQKGCLQTLLSPDGKILACYGEDFSLSLVDVDSGVPFFQKKDFYHPLFSGEFMRIFLYHLLRLGEPHIITMDFSPDTRYFAAAVGRDAVAAIDLSSRAPLALSSSLKSMMHFGFTFIAPDRIAGINYNQQKSGITTFPGGEVLQIIPMGAQQVVAPTQGDYLLLRPIPRYKLGVIDTHSKAVVLSNNRIGPIDIYNDLYVAESQSGELTIYGLGTDLPQEHLSLPRGLLGRILAGAVSPDLHWLAVSGLTRSGVWNLQNGQAIFRDRAFRGAFFAADGSLYADFPKLDEAPRTIARLDPVQEQVSRGAPLEENGNQHGPFLVVTKPAGREGSFRENVTLEVRDVRNSSLLWSRPFPKEAPFVFVEPLAHSMVLVWSAYVPGARNEIPRVPQIAARLMASKADKNDYFFEVLDARDGKVFGGMVLETGKGSIRITDAFAVGDVLIVNDNENRTLVYSIASGELKGKVFGSRPVLDPAARLLCAENERGQLTLYDIASMQKRDAFVFTSPISLMQFAADGKRLFVLTANQNAYILDVSGTAHASAASSSNR